MKKYISFLLIFFFLGFTSSGYSKTTKKTKKNTKTTVVSKKLEQEMLKREFERQLEASLISIAFSKNMLETQNSMNFLLDHPDVSYKAVKELLFNEEIASLNMINIWNIYSYLQAEQSEPFFTCSDISKLEEIHKNKIQFTSFLIKTTYTQCGNNFLPQIKEWLNSSDPLLYTEALSIIQSKNIQDFSQDILDSILKSNDTLKQELALTSLKNLDTKNIDLTKLIEYLKSPNPILRNASANLFSEKPEYREKLEQRFDAWFVSDFEKTAIIKAMRGYKSRETFDFMILTYPKNPAQVVEINQFFMNTSLSQRKIIEIINILPELKNTNLILAWLNLIYALLPQYIYDTIILDNLEEKLHMLEKKSNYTIDMDLKQIYFEIEKERTRKKLETTNE